MCNCEIVNGAKFVCDSCRRAMEATLADCYRREIEGALRSAKPAARAEDLLDDSPAGRALRLAWLERVLPLEAQTKAANQIRLYDPCIQWHVHERCPVDAYIRYIRADSD